MINLKTEKFCIKNIETVLFDKDGTFIDLHYFWGKMTELRAKEIIKQFNLNDNCLNQLCLFLGFDLATGKMLKDGITALYSRSKIIEIFQQDLLKLNVEITKEELTKIFDEVSEQFYKEMVQYTKPIDEAIEFIKELHNKGIKLGIVTSDSVESTKLTLKHFGWEDLFDCAIGRECSLQTKESGALTQIALTQLNANSKTTIMIGDAPMDYISAKNAGIDNIILVATGQLSKEELLDTTFYSVNSLKEVTID